MSARTTTPRRPPHAWRTSEWLARRLQLQCNSVRCWWRFIEQRGGTKALRAPQSATGASTSESRAMRDSKVDVGGGGRESDGDAMEGQREPAGRAWRISFSDTARAAVSQSRVLCIAQCMPRRMPSVVQLPPRLARGPCCLVPLALDTCARMVRRNNA